MSRSQFFRMKSGPNSVTAFVTAIILLGMSAPAWGGAVGEIDQRFTCEDDIFIVQGADAALHQCGSTDPLTCSPSQPPTLSGGESLEINNMGFWNGLLYAVELTPSGNNGIIKIDSDGDVEYLDNPVQGPSGVFGIERFDAGDVTPDGLMYLNVAGRPTVYEVDLNQQWPVARPIDVLGPDGRVHDWAYNPADGNLYGGDRDGDSSANQGQLARLAFKDSGELQRTDIAVPGLPRGTPFGGAWFASGLLYLHQNDGPVYKINVSDPDSPWIAGTDGGPDANRNDGASCFGACADREATCKTGTVQYADGDFACATPDAGGSDSVRVMRASRSVENQTAGLVQFYEAREIINGDTSFFETRLLDNLGNEVGIISATVAPSDFVAEFELDGTQVLDLVIQTDESPDPDCSWSMITDSYNLSGSAFGEPLNIDVNLNTNFIDVVQDAGLGNLALSQRSAFNVGFSVIDELHSGQLRPIRRSRRSGRFVCFWKRVGGAIGCAFSETWCERWDKDYAARCPAEAP